MGRDAVGLSEGPCPAKTTRRRDVYGFAESGSPSETFERNASSRSSRSSTFDALVAPLPSTYHRNVLLNSNFSLRNAVQPLWRESNHYAKVQNPSQWLTSPSPGAMVPYVVDPRACWISSHTRPSCKLPQLVSSMGPT